MQHSTKLLLPLVLGVLLSLTGCLSYEDVVFRGVNDIKMKKFSGRTLEAELTATVYNPNNYKISIVGSDFDVYSNGKYLGKAEIVEKVTLPKNAESTHTFTVKAKLKSAASGLGSMLGGLLKGSMMLELKGSVKARAKLISKRFPISIKERVEL